MSFTGKWCNILCMIIWYSLLKLTLTSNTVCLFAKIASPRTPSVTLISCIFTDVIPVSQLSIMQNLAQVDYCRTSAAVASGCTAGILGLTGIWGFIFYFLTASIVSVSQCTAAIFYFLNFLSFSCKLIAYTCAVGVQVRWYVHMWNWHWTIIIDNTLIIGYITLSVLWL